MDALEYNARKSDLQSEWLAIQRNNKAIAGVLQPTFLSAEFAIGPQIEAQDVEHLANAGFRSIINARPDSEEGDFRISKEVAGLAESFGLRYAYTPTDNHEIFEQAAIDSFEQAMARLPTPIFAHCKSGTRAAILWAMVAVRHQPTESVIAQLNASGQELSFLEDELMAERDSATRSPLRLKDEALIALGRSPLLIGRTGK